MRIFNNPLDYSILLDIQQQQLLYIAEKEQKQYELAAAKKAFEALPGVQSARARAENEMPEMCSCLSIL